MTTEWFDFNGCRDVLDMADKVKANKGKKMRLSEEDIYKVRRETGVFFHTINSCIFNDSNSENPLAENILTEMEETLDDLEELLSDYDEGDLGKMRKDAKFLLKSISALRKIIAKRELSCEGCEYEEGTDEAMDFFLESFDEVDEGNIMMDDILVRVERDEERRNVFMYMAYDSNLDSVLCGFVTNEKGKVCPICPVKVVDHIREQLSEKGYLDDRSSLSIPDPEIIEYVRALESEHDMEDTDGFLITLVSAFDYYPMEVNPFDARINGMQRTFKINVSNKDSGDEEDEVTVLSVMVGNDKNIPEAVKNIRAGFSEREKHYAEYGKKQGLENNDDLVAYLGYVMQAKLIFEDFMNKSGWQDDIEAFEKEHSRKTS